MTKKRWTVKAKAKIVIESLTTTTSTANICRKYGLSPNPFYPWREEFLEGGRAALVWGPSARPQRRFKRRTLRSGLSTVRINPRNYSFKTADPAHPQTGFDCIIPSGDSRPWRLRPQIPHYPPDPGVLAQSPPRVPGETGLFLSPIRQRDSGRWT